MKKSTRRRVRGQELTAEQEQLLHSLEENRRELSVAQKGFDSTEDPDLTEYYLYQINAFRARDTYLLRRMKALTVPDAVPVGGPDAGKEAER